LSRKDEPCWECKSKPRRKRPGSIFLDTVCEECGAKGDAMTPEQRRQHIKDVFDRNIAAIGAGLTGPELRGMLADVARDELAKLRSRRGREEPET